MTTGEPVLPSPHMTHRILIVGGGFGGVTAALKLHKHHHADTEVTLVTSKPWLEYYGVLYRLIGGAHASQACLPLEIVLGHTRTKVVIDSIGTIDPSAKTAKGAHAVYEYDTLLLAPGSTPAYFNIPGMEEHSITMKHMDDARHIRSIILAQKATQPYVIVGGGPTGIEIAGEIMNLAPGATVHLIEAMDRILPVLEPSASAHVLRRLTDLGVHVHLNTAVAAADATRITLKDGTTMDAPVLIWTAGVRAHPMLETIPGLELDKRKRVVVDEQLRAKGQQSIFVLGDCASTPFAGMAQTAVEDGNHAAHVIAAMLSNKPLPVYKPIAPAYAIPAGNHWSAVKFGVLRVYGLLGHALRRAADLHVYMLVLPWRYVLPAFRGTIKLERYGITQK